MKKMKEEKLAVFYYEVGQVFPKQATPYMSSIDAINSIDFPTNTHYWFENISKERFSFFDVFSTLGNEGLFR